MSKAAFFAANSFTFLVMAIVVGVFAPVIPLFAPGPDGTQLRPIRAWHSWCARADPELARCLYTAPTEYYNA